jgi:hypothetical protein
MLKTNLIQRIISILNPDAQESERLARVYHPQPDPDSMARDRANARQYAGRLVDWDLCIENMDEGLDSQNILVLTFFGRGSTKVWLTVQIQDNPDIFDCGAGSQVRVKGKIKAIRDGAIYLEDCLIEY